VEIRAPQPDRKRTVALIVALGALTAGGAYTLTEVFGADCGSSSFHSDPSDPAKVTCVQ
jgi:hypothetical protein